MSTAGPKAGRPVVVLRCTWSSPIVGHQWDGAGACRGRAP